MKRRYVRGTLQERFNAYVGEPTPFGCLPWTGTITRGGYGRISDATGSHLAHRLAWKFAGKTFTPGLELRHTCNNSQCVNVEHLVEGTHQQNIMDAVAAKTMGRKPKFTEEDYLTVFALKKAGWLQRDIAKHLNCSTTHISTILNGGIVKW